MASIYTKGNKIYMSWYDTTHGKRFNKSTGLEASSANMRKAKKYAKIFQNRLDEETEKLKSQNIKRVTISFAFDQFLIINGDKHIKTVKDYHRFYSKFIEYFDKNELCGIINKSTVEDWLIEIKKLPLQPNSIFGYYKQLNHFLNFLFEYNYVPMFKLNRAIKPKPEVKEKIVFSTADIERIFARLNERSNNFQTLVNTLFFTGLRSSDIMTITADRIDLKRRSIRYYSPKRKRYREIGFHEDLLPTLAKRIELVKDGPLFDYKNVENLGRAVRRYLDNIGLKNKGYSARTFRKTFITLCRESGIDATIVAELVGHEHRSTADRFYYNITIDVMKNELKKFRMPE